jgi:hypothetical protein
VAIAELPILSVHQGEQQFPGTYKLTIHAGLGMDLAKSSAFEAEQLAGDQ